MDAKLLTTAIQIMKNKRRQVIKETLTESVDTKANTPGLDSLWKPNQGFKMWPLEAEPGSQNTALYKRKMRGCSCRNAADSEKIHPDDLSQDRLAVEPGSSQKQ